jgi:hypothetical protein
METYISIFQGIFYILTGIWPLISIGTFQMVTGPKTDLWLVQTVGVLITVIGAVLAYAAYIGEISSPVILLAVGSAAALTAVDVIFYLRGIIARVYLLDAIAETAIVAIWILTLWFR